MLLEGLPFVTMQADGTVNSSVDFWQSGGWIALPVRWRCLREGDLDRVEEAGSSLRAATLGFL